MGHRTQERTRKAQVALLITQKVQEVTVTESNVSEEEVEDVSEDMWAYTRADLEVTDVKRKYEDEANIDSDNESEYDSETD